MSGDRDAIFGRIREALSGAPAPHHDGGTLAASAHHEQFDQWLPPVGDSEADRIALFAELSEKLKTEFHDCAGLDEAAEVLRQLAADNGWKRLASHRSELTDALLAKLGDTPERLLTDDGYDADDLEASDAGLTACECLVAQTGSVCATSRSSGGRALSVLPPHHVVIARRGQLVADLSDAYERLAQSYPGGYPSLVTFITGPSRTGDIERILVLGAHGPKRLTVLLVP